MVALHGQELGEISAARGSSTSRQNVWQPVTPGFMIDAFIRDLRQPEYLHVLLNPIPVYGLGVALIGLLIAIVMRRRNAKIVTLWFVRFCSAIPCPASAFGHRHTVGVLSMSDEQVRLW